MITRLDAEAALHESIVDFKKKKGQYTLSDIETETINNACLLILKEYGSQIKSVHDINQINVHINNNMHLLEQAQYFTSYARSLFPEHYTSAHAEAANFMIIQNITWAGMWDFLRNYFMRIHGKKIDEALLEAVVFDSTRHERFEGEIMTSSSEVVRKIIVNFTDDRNEIVVSIEPSLSAKKARLKDKTESQYHYEGYDPDYAFMISLDSFNEIDLFYLEMPNRNLKIIYYE